MCQVVRDRDAGVDCNELEPLNRDEIIRKECPQGPGSGKVNGPFISTCSSLPSRALHLTKLPLRVSHLWHFQSHKWFWAHDTSGESIGQFNRADFVMTDCSVVVEFIVIMRFKLVARSLSTVKYEVTRHEWRMYIELTELPMFHGIAASRYVRVQVSSTK